MSVAMRDEIAPVEASHPLTRQWSLEALLALTGTAVLELWRQAPAATLEELQGHFMGLIPNAGDVDQQIYTAKTMFNVKSSTGYWLGKAYRKTGHNQGEGYNRWRLSDGRVVRNLRFETEIGRSLIDGRESLLMYYGAFQKDNPTFVDEIRKLDDGIYLGVGSILEGGKRAPGHFMLLGPTDEWVGCEMEERVADFVKPEA